MNTLKLQVNEIKCQGCADKITKTIKKLKNVILLEINVATKTVIIEYNSSKINERKIIEKITSLGYPSISQL